MRERGGGFASIHPHCPRFLFTPKLKGNRDVCWGFFRVPLLPFPLPGYPNKVSISPLLSLLSCPLTFPLIISLPFPAMLSKHSVRSSFLLRKTCPTNFIIATEFHLTRVKVSKIDVYKKFDKQLALITYNYFYVLYLFCTSRNRAISSASPVLES